MIDDVDVANVQLSTQTVYSLSGFGRERFSVYTRVGTSVCHI